MDIYCLENIYRIMAVAEHTELTMKLAIIIIININIINIYYYFSKKLYIIKLLVLNNFNILLIKHFDILFIHTITWQSMVE